MARDTADQAHRKPRGKRAPRNDSGRKIVVRVDDSEWQNLQLLAVGVNVSTYVRTRLFDGPVRHHERMRMIAALHVAGRGLQMLASDRNADHALVADTLVQVRTAIARLAITIPVAADDEEQL